MPRYFLNRNRGLFSELDNISDEEMVSEENYSQPPKKFFKGFIEKVEKTKYYYRQRVEDEKEYYASSSSLRFDEQNEKNEQFLKKVLYFSIGTIFILFLSWLFFR